MEDQEARCPTARFGRVAWMMRRDLPCRAGKSLTMDRYRSVRWSGVEWGGRLVGWFTPLLVVVAVALSMCFCSECFPGFTTLPGVVDHRSSGFVRFLGVLEYCFWLQDLRACCKV